MRSSGLLAAALGVTLVVASCGDDDVEVSVQGRDVTGEEVFVQSGCGACHVLRGAATTGTFGPNLDRLEPEAEHVAHFVRVGGVGMPSFGSLLTDEEIDAVARFVSQVAGT